MMFDTRHVVAMRKESSLQNGVRHEMAHVLGIGKGFRGLLKPLNDQFLGYTGKNALRTYRDYGGRKGPLPVTKSRESHWSFLRLGSYELMTERITRVKKSSRITMLSLNDIGVLANPKVADYYRLPPFPWEDIEPVDVDVYLMEQSQERVVVNRFRVQNVLLGVAIVASIALLCLVVVLALRRRKTNVS